MQQTTLTPLCIVFIYCVSLIRFLKIWNHVTPGNRLLSLHLVYERIYYLMIRAIKVINGKSLWMITLSSDRFHNCVFYVYGNVHGMYLIVAITDWKHSSNPLLFFFIYYWFHGLTISITHCICCITVSYNIIAWYSLIFLSLYWKKGKKHLSKKDRGLYHTKILFYAINLCKVKWSKYTISDQYKTLLTPEKEIASITRLDINAGHVQKPDPL